MYPHLPMQIQLPQTIEVLKIMVLQCTLQYHEALDWILLQESQLTYQSLLAHCKLLESYCEQYQKAKEKGQADLTTITAETSSASSIHTDALSIYPHCNKCGYSHPCSKCPVQGKTCYVCCGSNHYTALCKWKKMQWPTHNTPRTGDRSPRSERSPWDNRSKHRSHHSSQSPSRQLHCHIPSCQSCSTSCSPFYSMAPCWLDWSHHWHTLFQYSQDSIEIIPAAAVPTNSIETSTHPKGSLLTECTSDGQVSFYTRLQLPPRNRIKLMTIKIDPVLRWIHPPEQVPEAIPPTKSVSSGSLSPTSHTLILHDGSPKPYLGHFITEVQCATPPRSYPTHFYVFEDTTSPQILLSYATLERLGILEFKVPNLAAHSTI